MLRLDYCLMRGGLLIKGDLCTDVDGDDTPMEYDCLAEYWNKDGEENSKCHIKSFAFRDNNGIKPVPDDFPVVICGNNGVERSKLAIDVEWKLTALRSSNGAYYAIKSWKPDINKLLEQQNEYDKQQEKPIEEIMINAKESKMSEFKEHQRVYVEGYEDTKWSWGCLTLDGEKCILLSDSGHMVMPISKVSATPFKTELEIAQEEQVEIMVAMYGIKKSIAKQMQYNCHLAEIILPLKDK